MLEVVLAVRVVGEIMADSGGALWWWNYLAVCGSGTDMIPVVVGCDFDVVVRDDGSSRGYSGWL